ncbi:hypothetical protein [Solimonas aquatica]|uniref:hypothetical protein n=1 Tax=Solimonas aquatica TaxID=489703 RepID=UPI000B8568AD|nr:hypothetical protein [Solimonas aquatica]
MKTRKQVYDLIPADLHQTAVWEFALDEEGEEGQDEATVRPVNVEGSLNTADGMFIVWASFVLADGSHAEGYLTPGVQGDNHLSSVQPAVVAEGGQVSFWCGLVAPERGYLDRCYKVLGKQPNEIFPLSYQSQVNLVGGTISGSIPGFVVLEDMKSGRTRVVR